MKLPNARRLYEILPMPLKRLGFGVIPYAWIAGRQYRKTLELCRILDRCDTREVAAFQQEKLHEILTYAVNRVPFYKPYRSRLERYGSAQEALKEFPLITKEFLQEHFGEMLSVDLNRIPHLPARTGGSSGNQLEFRQDRALYGIEMGFMHSLWARAGYRPSCRKATFRGVLFRNRPDQVFWQYNPVHNELQFSPFHMSDANLFRYLERLKRYRPEFLHGYPSALAALAEFVLSHGLEQEMPPIRAALCGSEPCSAEQRRKISAAFRTRVYTWYGHSERVILAGECEFSRVYHALPGYGRTELIGASGNECAEGENGELVGTGFWNRSMPLIRYRTGDRARQAGPQCACDRHCVRFDRVEGHRDTSGVTGRSGAWISAAALNMHERVFDHVSRFQYYQPEAGKLEIRVIPGKNWRESDRDAILVLHRAKVGDELELSCRVVEKIPLTRSGKHLTILAEHDNKPQRG